MDRGSTTANAHLRIKGVSKAFALTQALDQVDLEVSRGEIHALLGSNGSGKSTLIKILASVYAADAGRLEINGFRLDLTKHQAAQAQEAGLRFLHQEPSIFPDLTVAENLELGLDSTRNPLTRVSPSSLRDRTKATLERYEIDAEPETAVGDLRPAAQTMLGIARILHADEDASQRVLILDEPTSTLEAEEVSWLFDALRQCAAAGQTIIFVSHQLDEVIDLADRATVFRDGRNAGTVSRAEFSEEKLGELIVGRPLDTYFPNHDSERDETPTFEATGLKGDRVHELDLKVYGGEIVGLAGLIGSGHSEILRLLFGADPILSGRIHVEGQEVTLSEPQDAIDAGIAFVPADRTADGIFPELSVRENLSVASLRRYRGIFGMNRQEECADADRDIDRFGIVTSSPNAQISSLSGGNQQKAVIARCLRLNPRVLLLDNPTQGVDIGARADLWVAVEAEVAGGMAVLMASSDLEELARVCDRILIVQAGCVTNEIQGGSVSADDLLELLHTPVGVAA